MQQFESLSGEQLALANLATQMFRGESAKVVERHANGTGRADDGGIVSRIVYRDFASKTQTVTPWLFKFCI